LFCRSGHNQIKTKEEKLPKKENQNIKEKRSGDLQDVNSEYIILLLQSRPKQGRTRIRERDDARRWMSVNYE
jgi:hypothetical protein